MIHLNQTAVVVKDGALAKLREEFLETGTARLPGFLDGKLLNPLLDWVAKAQFEVRNEVHQGEVFGTTLFVPDDDPALFLLNFMLNKPSLFTVIESVVGCPSLANFTGRIHRTSAGTSQHIDWHDDAIYSRTAGITIGLGVEHYTGGVLQLRDPEKRIRSEVGYCAPGDAFLFRIDKGWKHKLTAVETGSRTVGVGWFRTQPDFRIRASDTARSLRILGTANHTLVA